MLKEDGEKSHEVSKKHTNTKYRDIELEKASNQKGEIGEVERCGSRMLCDRLCTSASCNILSRGEGR